MSPQDSQPQEQGQNQENVEGETLAFDAWLEKQPENVKTMLDGHTKGLKSALESERGSRKDLEKQLREMAKKAESGSETQSSLTEMADQLAEADRRADFYEAAHREGVTNLKLAFTVAVQDDLIDKKGQVDFSEMKKSYPELFGSKTPPRGNAGDGTTETQKPGGGMNQFIRKAAGRS